MDRFFFTPENHKEVIYHNARYEIFIDDHIFYITNISTNIKLTFCLDEKRRNWVLKNNITVSLLETLAHSDRVEKTVRRMLEDIRGLNLTKEFSTQTSQNFEVFRQY